MRRWRRRLCTSSAVSCKYGLERSLQVGRTWALQEAEVEVEAAMMSMEAARVSIGSLPQIMMR